MIEWNKVYKIKDSIDVYLQDNKLLVFYFMNTRIHKKFLINSFVKDVIALIDGNKTLENIYLNFKETHIDFNISRESFLSFFNKLFSENIICSKLERHILSKYYLDRYDRQINYFTEFLGSEEAAEKAQKRIIDCRIGVIGCGAVGGNIALQLAMSGVENFVLMDYDYVSESDCSRHIYYNSKNNNKKKTEALDEKLKKINHKISTYLCNANFYPNVDMTDFLNRVDFIIDTADEPYLGLTANLLSHICVPKRIPHYIAGGFDAHLASTGELIIPYVTPCAACYSTYFNKKLENWKPETHPVTQRSLGYGGLSSMTLFASSFGCIEIIKYISGLIDMNTNYKSRGEFYFTNMDLFFLETEKDSKCKVCGNEI